MDSRNSDSRRSSSSSGTSGVKSKWIKAFRSLKLTTVGSSRQVKQTFFVFFTFLFAKVTANRRDFLSAFLWNFISSRVFLLWISRQLVVVVVVIGSVLHWFWPLQFAEQKVSFFWIKNSVQPEFSSFASSFLYQ